MMRIKNSLLNVIVKKIVFILLINICFLITISSPSIAYMTIRVNYNWYPTSSFSYGYYGTPSFYSMYVPVTYPFRVVKYPSYAPVVQRYDSPVFNLMSLGESKKEAYFKAKEEKARQMQELSLREKDREQKTDDSLIPKIKTEDKKEY